MSHADALLTPTGRLRPARCIVDDGWSLRRAAGRFQVWVIDRATLGRSLPPDGETGMHDRSSRPARSPRRTLSRAERRIVKLRWIRRWGPARIGDHPGLHPSTVHEVLCRYKMARLAWLDRPTGRVIRRYEHAQPGDMVHLDIKKLDRVADGGGHRIHFRAWWIRSLTVPSRVSVTAAIHRARAGRRPGPTGRGRPARRPAPPRSCSRSSSHPPPDARQ